MSELPDDPALLDALLRVSRRQEPRRWRLWWRFGFGPICCVVNLLPIAEWRKETWLWHVDIWGMDHFGKRGEAPDGK